MLKKDIIVTIEDRQFRIKRFKLDTISYLITKFGSKLLPLLKEYKTLANMDELKLDSDVLAIIDNLDFTSLTIALGSLTQADIKELYEIVFSNVLTQANDADTILSMPLIGAMGEYTIPDMDYDIKLSMNILIEVIKNQVGFIQGSN